METRGKYFLGFGLVKLGSQERSGFSPNLTQVLRESSDTLIGTIRTFKTNGLSNDYAKYRTDRPAIIFKINPDYWSKGWTINKNL